MSRSLRNILTADGRRDACGATAVLENGSGELGRRVRADGSYPSSNDPRILFGLVGQAGDAYRVRVIWPDGRKELFSGLAPGRYRRLLQDGGQEVKQ